MNQAWQTVDSAKEWMLLHTTSSPSNVVFGDLSKSEDNDNTFSKNKQSNEDLIWMKMPAVSLSSFLSSFNPFLDKRSDHRDNVVLSSSTSASSSSSSSKAIVKSPTSSVLFLPKFASRFEWATRQRNPYQAVIGRDVYYAEYDWSSWLQFPNWLITNQQQYHPYDDESRIIGSRSSSESSRDKNFNNHQQYVKDSSDYKKRMTASTTEERAKQQSSHGGKKSRTHSRTSDASIQAVKDLLTLVRQHVVAMELHRSEEVAESHSILLHRKLEEEQPSTSSPDLTPLTQTVSSSSHTSSLSATPTNPSLTARLVLSSSLPMTSPNTDPKLSKGDSFDSEGNLLIMRSSPVRATPRLSSSDVDDNFPSEAVQSEWKSTDKQQAIKAEMASLLAEGTLRVYRDLALDEATELRSALHHWTIRWERPFLGWLEAGPQAWFQVGDEVKEGYTTSPPPPHLAAGKKVSQIQVVLARRCAVIGELQQHLWRASWQKGVAGWGMLGGGVGGEWTSVVRFSVLSINIFLVLL